MHLDILGQYIVILLQYAWHISQYIAIRLWHIVTALECRLLIIFANSLDPDQAQQNVGPDLDPNYLTL